MNDEIPSTPTPSIPHPTSSNRCWKTVRTVWTILFWYLVSNAIILSTKELFTKYFPYPLTVTTFSNGVAFLWAALVSVVFGRCGWHHREPLTRQMLESYVLPIGVTTALEIGCSNIALKINTVSFGTILKGGGPIWTFAWGLAFGLEQFSCQVGISLLLIAVGIALASLGEGQEFAFWGFFLQLFASALGGLRWAMTHKLLKEGNSGDEDAPKPMSPLTATLYTSPMTSLCVLPFALVLEGSAVWTAEHHNHNMTALPLELESTHNTTQQLLDAATNSTQQLLSVDTTNVSDTAIILSTMTGIATLVFILLMSEYWLVKATSSLALSVAGVFKELLTIGGGIFLFSEHIDALNVVGFVTCQLGIITYVCLRAPGNLNNPDGEYAPVTVEEAAREAMEAHQEMLAEFGQEQFVDEQGDGAASQFTIDDEDL